MIKSIAIAGIHTGIGKTIASAVIAEATGADYWKPVQAGIEERDATLVKQLLTNGSDRVFDEAVLLSQPLSPHAAAAIDRIAIDYSTFTWPETNKTLIVETAGGILSPISANKTAADFIAYYHLPVILVSQNYLGSINHTLLTIETLKHRNIRIMGMVMNGIENKDSESFIEQYSGVKIIARIPHFSGIDRDAVSACAAQIKNTLSAFFV